MKKILLLALVSSGLLFSTIANSSLITANGVAINPLDLTGDYNSFEEFFDYRTSDSSSHTGYEKSNRIVVFLTQIQNEIGVIMTGSAAGPNGNSGDILAKIAGTQGAISFIDDPANSGFADVINGSVINWIYSPKKSDGLIFSGLFSPNWDVNIGLRKNSGGISGVDVLTFDENQQVSTLFSTGISKNGFSPLYLKSIFSPEIIAVSVVNTPALFILFGLALTFLGFRVKR